MKAKGKLILAVAAALIVAGGIFSLAAEYGTQSDPLVSLSYINSMLVPDILKQVDTKIDARAETINSAIASYDERIDKKLFEFSARQTAGLDDKFIDKVADRVSSKVQGNAAASPFEVISIPAGKTLQLSAGCEILLRDGNANCVAANASGMVDMTTGGTLASGAALSKNHLYLASADGLGIKAQSNLSLLVRGKRKLS